MSDHENMFEHIKSIVGDRALPIGGVSQGGELFVIEQGKDDAGEFFRITTLQDNDWLRVNTYYACGDATETYKK